MPKKTVTKRQLAANRANAKHSTGPNTRQGKLRAAYNSLSHGLTAVTVVLPGEDAERYDYLRQEYINVIQPANPVETHLADLFVATQWRRERSIRYETALALEGRAFWDSEIKQQYPGTSESVVDGLIFGRRANGKSDRTLQHLDRYERRMISSSVRTWKLLKEIQNNRPPIDPGAPDAIPGPPAPMDPWPHPLPERVAPRKQSAESEPQEPPQPEQKEHPETHNEKKPNEPIPETGHHPEQLKPELTTNNQQPTTNNQQPTTNNQQLTTDNRQLTTTNPPATTEAPATSDPLSPLLTANQRLSRTLRQAHDDQQCAAGRTAWTSPAILPFSTWLDSKWSEALLAGAAPPATLLSADQEENVWRWIIAEAPESANLLDLRGTAQSAMQAWKLVHQYRVPLDGQFQAQEDQAAFLGWAAEYRRACAEENWLDEARLPDAVRDSIASGAVGLPESVLLAGFDEFTPQQKNVLEALRVAGCRVEALPVPGQESKPVRRPCKDADDEFRSAAEWARDQLETSTARSIGIVLLNLGARRSRLERIFDQTLGRPAYHITIPDPLSDYPLIASALLLLRLAPQSRWPLGEAGLLLRTPFTAGGMEEAPERAVLDAKVRRWRRSHVTVQSIAAQAAGCPQLTSILEKWKAMSFANVRLPSEWSAVFRATLDAAGWPGDRVLSSHEYQVLESWLELFRTFSSLDVVTGPMTFGAAAARLGEMAAAARFQPKDPGAPVQIMGVLEAAGSRFDALWITGATDQTWPAPSHPHPFLPLAAQKALKLPHSSPEREFDFAQRTFARLRASAPEMVVSWAMRAGDVELRRSPLLDGIPEQAAPERAQTPRPAPAWESLMDEAAPALETTRPRGGTRVLKLQAACPFQAFADLRLGARPLDAAELGMSAMERGSAIHEALRMFWAEVRDHAALIAMTSEELLGVAGRAAAGALERPFRDTRHQFDLRFRDLETRRLTQALVDQAEFEKTRSPFRVASHERERTIAIGGLELDARIDRVDELPGGRQVIIDYKTTAPSPSAWEGERPDEPQLPLYAISNEAPVAGVAFAAVGSDQPSFRGYAAADGVLPGTKPFPMPPARQLAEWRRVLEPIAEAFRLGNAAVDPKAKAACDLCRLTSLCRIHEAAPADPEENDETA